MHNSKMAWFRAIMFCIIFVIINNLIVFSVCPKGNYSRNTLREMYTIDKNIDIVFAGSSYTIKDVNPYIMDKKLECNTFDYSFPSQIYTGTYYSLKELFKYHKPKLVVVTTDIESYVTKEEKVMAYIPVVMNFKSLLPKIEFFINLAKDGSYLDRLFVWRMYHTKSLEDTIYNISKKIDKNYINYPTKDQLEAYKNNKYGYIGKGFVPADENDSKYILDNNKLGRMVRKSTDLGEIKSQNVEYLKKIVKLCRQNNSELILLHTPVEPSLIFSENNYFRFNEKISEIAKEEGVEYYDYNLIKSELFKVKLGDGSFLDKFHLNGKGADEFSKSFAQFLKLRNSGEDMSKYFYTPEEYLDTINYINNTWFTWKMNKDKIDIKADSFYGNNIKPEYQFILIDSKTGKKEVIRDYDTNPNFTLEKPKLSTYKIRVNAREVGNNVEFSRYYEEEFGKK